MELIIKKIKFFLDWNYIISYNELVNKSDGVSIKASLNMGFIIGNFITPVVASVFKNLVGNNKMLAVISLVFYSLTIFLFYFYYERLNNRVKIKYVQKKYDYLKQNLLIAFIFVYILVFFIYVFPLI